MIYVLSCVLLLFFAYMSFKAHYDIVDDRIIYDKQLPRSFENFRIFFIADVHRRRINEATLKTINLKIDIVLIGGDLTEKHVPLQRTLNNIQKLKQFNAPILFVWGNNDHEVPTNAFVKLLTKENIVILNDTYKNIAKNGDEISIFGLNYYENDYNRPQIYWGNAQEKYMILLTHKPSSFYQLTKKEKKNINTVLAGHTHGGQIRLFGLGFYQKGGLINHKRTNVFITEGYGYTFLPFRLHTKAECHVLTFKNEKK